MAALKALARPRRSIRNGIGRPLKRYAMRTVVVLIAIMLFGHALADIFRGPAPIASPAAAQTIVFPGEDMRAYAARFTRAYLTLTPEDPEGQGAVLQPMLAPGLRGDADVLTPARGRAQRVTDTSINATRTLRLDPAVRGRQRSGRALITVAAGLDSGRTRYLAVTVQHDRAGGLAVTDYPAFVGEPPAANLSTPTSEEPVSGPHAEAVTTLMGQFLPVYLAGGRVPSVYLAPGVSLAALNDRFDRVELVSVLDGGSLPSGDQLVFAVVRARDTQTRSQYTLRYGVGIRRTDRWLVSQIQGDFR